MQYTVLRSELDALVLGILIQSDYLKYKNRLSSAEEEVFTEVIYSFAKEHWNEWVPLLIEKLETINSHKAMQQIFNIFKKLDVQQYENLLQPFLSHENHLFRLTAYDFLNGSKFKRNYFEEFKLGLRDENVNVLRRVLQALLDFPRAKLKQLKPLLEEVSQKHPTNEDSIQSNLNNLHRKMENPFLRIFKS